MKRRTYMAAISMAVTMSIGFTCLADTAAATTESAAELSSSETTDAGTAGSRCRSGCGSSIAGIVRQPVLRET